MNCLNKKTAKSKMIRSIIYSFLSYFFILGQTVAIAQSTAAILPQGRTQFFDNNGNPLSSGTVGFYIPSTLTTKTTWQDSSKAVANTNPVTLDAGGRATIYGDGTYRQIVKDRNGNLIWDAVTASVGTGGGTTGTGDGDLVGTIKPWAGLSAPNQYAFAYGQEVSRTTYSALFTAITLQQNISCTSGSPIASGFSDTSQVPNGAIIESTCFAAGTTVVSKTATTITFNNNSTISTTDSVRLFLYGNGNGSTTFNLPDLRGNGVVGRCNMGGTNCSNLSSTYFGTNPQATGAVGGSQSTTLVGANLPAYTPAGTNDAPGITSSPVFNSSGTNIYTPVGTVGAPSITFSSSGTNIYTPAGSVSSPSITISGGTIGGTSFATTIAGGGVIDVPINHSTIAAALSGAPTFSGNANTVTASAPAFSGNAVGLSVTSTLNAAPIFTGTAQGGTSTPFANVSPSITLNFIIKITPDSNSADASGVTSLGSMTGDIACGTGLLCTGNTVSVTAAGSTGPLGTVLEGQGFSVAPAFVTPPFPFYDSGDATNAVANTWLSRADATVAPGVFVRAKWASGPGIFILAGGTGVVATSKDGINYKLGTSASASNWHGIAYIPSRNRIVMSAGGSTTTGIQVSDDNGATWVNKNTPNTNNIDALIYIDEVHRLVGACYSGGANRIVISDDYGETWSAITTPTSNDFTSVAYSPQLKRVVAMSVTGVGNRIMTSDDYGSTWTTQAFATDKEWDDVIWINDFGGRFVAVNYTSANTTVGYSPSGLAGTWTLVATPTTNLFTRLAYSSELKTLAAVSHSPGGTNGLMVSFDGGANWSMRTTTAVRWGAIDWSPALGIFAGASWDSNKMVSNSTSLTGRFNYTTGAAVSLGTQNFLSNRQISIGYGNLPFAGLGFANSSGTELWAFGIESGAGADRLAAFNTTLGTYALLINHANNQITFPAYSAGLLSTDGSGNITAVSSGSSNTVLVGGSPASFTATPTIGGLVTIKTNTGTLPTPIAGGSTLLRLGAVDGPFGTRAEIQAFGAGSGDSPTLYFISAQGTAAVPTATQNGNFIGFVAGLGYGATAYPSTPRAAMAFNASQNWTDANQGTQITFSTTPNGSTTRGTAFTINQDKSFNASNIGTISTNTATTLPSPQANGTPLLRIAGPDGTATATRAEIQAFGSNAADSPTLLFVTARNTAASPTATQSGDFLGFVSGIGYGATAYASVGRAAIAFNAAQNWTDAAQGSYIDIQTTASGGTTRATKYRIENDGGLTGPNTVTGGSKGSGTINVTTGYYIGGTAIPWTVSAPLALSAGGVLSLGTIGVANGGTGLTSYTIGDLIQATGSTTLSTIADVSIGSVLASGGIGAGVSWSTTPNISGSLRIGQNTTINSGEKVQVSNNTSNLQAASFGTPLMHIAAADGTISDMLLESYGNQPRYTFRRANGTAASPTAIVSGNTIASFFFNGYKATGYNTTDAAGIFGKAPSNWTDASTETDITIATIPSGSNVAAEVIRFLGAGNVKFSNTASFSANGAVATVLGSIGPTGSHTTVQKWLTIVDSTGTTLYIPAF